MGNKLFQQARDFTEQARISQNPQAIATAKNAISSAYANSTDAEKLQLRAFQETIDSLS